MNCGNVHRIGLIFLLLFSLNITRAQVLNDNNNTSPVYAEFTKENIKIEARSIFFNVLKIYNPSDQNRTINLRFETPVGWSLISHQEERITLTPKDTIRVPLQAATNKHVKGEIGYSIIGTITTTSGEPITSAYCFIKVPRKTELQFRPLTRISYIDQKTQKGNFTFRLINKGNVDEVVNLEFRSTPNLKLRNEVNNSFSTDIVIPAKTDSTFSYDVIKTGKDVARTLYKVDLTGYTEKTSFNTTFWFKNLMNTYKYEKPMVELPLIINLNLENFFSEYNTFLTGGAKGTLLFEDHRKLNYYFFKYNRRGESFLDASRIYLKYTNNKMSITAGDRIGFHSIYGYGRGVAFNYDFLNKFRIGGKYNYNLFNPINNYGIHFELLKSEVSFDADIEFSHDQKRNQNLLLGYFRGNYAIDNNHKIYADFSLSDLYKNSLVNRDSIGYHHWLKYRGKINDMRIRFGNRYSTNNYFGRLSGRNKTLLSITKPFEDQYYLRLFVNNFNTRPYNLFREEQHTDVFYLNRDIGIRMTRNFDNAIAVFAEPSYNFFNSNSFFNSLENRADFKTNSYYIKLGSRFQVLNDNRFSLAFKGGYTFVSDFYHPDKLDNLDMTYSAIQEREVSFNSILDLSYYSRNWGAFFKYFHGPYNGNQYFNYFYYDEFNQTLRLTPYYRDYIYKDLIEMDSRLNYIYSINYQTHRINLGNQVRFHMNYGIMLSLIANFTLQSSLEASQSSQIFERQRYNYTSTYFELRLEKQFGWNQPRTKYYDLEVHLYKDLNGNLKKDYNEPGVKNVLVNIEKVDPAKVDTFEVDYEDAGNLMNNRLLSGMKGKVGYQNMPQGIYRINIKRVGTETGKYSADQQEVLIHMNQDRQVYIPFLERNKIFGRVILNRSKLSNLGEMDASNIKVIAEDSKGRKSTTLTDNKGRFTIYAPSVDLYDVYINNIFQDHFDLRKNHYKVQLNGYQQFEVNFIFDEKRRQIKFTPSMEETDVEVKSVRRTNLTGVVKDENTLQPLRATIEVIDNKTGSTIETINSDRETGRFSMSFMTGTSYALIVSAPGYWFHSEDLDLDQMLTIQDIEKEILLENIIIGSKIELNNLIFDPGSAEIPNDAYPELDRLINQLKQNPNVRIQIAGYADALEQLDQEDISEERAKAVAKYMMQNGFSNIEYVGYEDRRPAAPNDSPGNRAKNRRVEMTVVDK